MINWALKPTTDKPSLYARKVADKIDRPSPQTTRAFDPNSYLGQYEDFGTKLNSQIRGGISGAVEGAGDYLSGMTSPFSMAATAIGAAPFLRAGQAITSLGRIAPEVEQATVGIGPTASKIPEWVAMGAEDAYNAGKSIYTPMRTAEEIAYENIMRNGGRSNTGSNLLLEHMQRVQAAKGK